MRRFFFILALIIFASVTAFGQARTASEVQNAPVSALNNGNPPNGSIRFAINGVPNTTPCQAAAVGAPIVGSLAMKIQGVWVCLPKSTFTGAGTGDVNGPSASSESELPLFSGTTGKIIDRSDTLNGYVKLTSGVVAAAPIPVADLPSLTSAQLATLVTDETGSGLAVFGTAPNIIAPTGITKADIGLPLADDTSDATKNAAVVALTNHTISGATNTLTNLPAANISGVIPIANLATGTPTGSKFIRDDGTLATIPGGGDALQSSPLSQFAATTSVQLAGVINNESGSGLLVFGTSPNITTPTGIVKGDVGLGSVDNTADTAKPVSTAQQTALDLKANLASPTFTGTPTLPTGTIAVTQSAGNSTTAVATTAFVTTADNLKANLASPTLTGTPTLPTGTIAVTQSAGDSTTAVATTAFVTTADNLKANLAGPTFTGTPTLPTGTIQAGSLLVTAIVAPGTPAAGKGSVYVDSTSKNLAVKDDAGVVKHGVQTQSAVSNSFVTAINDAGGVTVAQPAFTNISGTATAGQLPTTAVNTVTNDTNITGSITAQALTLGFTGTLAKTRQNAATVYNDASNTYSTGTQDFGAATALKVPTSAGAAPTASGRLAYDSTANRYVGGLNGANKVFVMADSVDTFTNKTIDATTNTILNLGTANIASASLGGNGTKLATTGITTPASSKCVEVDSNGVLQIAGTDAACGAGGGGGDVTLAGTQTFTGPHTFNSSKLILAGSSSGTTILNASAAAGSTTLILPAANDTLVARDTSETLTNKSLTSPTLTGVPVSPTAAPGNNSTQVATTAYVDAAAVLRGDLFGPGSSTDNALVRFDSTTGKLIQNSVGILDDSGNLSGIASLVSTLGSTLRIGGVSRTTDAVPAAYQMQSESAWSQAATNITGAALRLAPGIGVRKFTSVSNVLGAVAVTIVVDSNSGVTLTSGVDFTLGTDDTGPELAVTASNLATAINGNGTLSAKLAATASGAIVFLDKLDSTLFVDISTDQSARISATSSNIGDIFIGAGAGNVAGTAAGRVFIGAGAGQNITSGSLSVFIGKSAGKAMTTGASNTLVGNSAGLTLTGSSNAFFGSSAGVSATTDTQSTFIGPSAGLRTAGTSGNTYVGYAIAGVSVNSGIENTVVGAFGGNDFTTATRNTLVGYGAGFHIVDMVDNVYIGYKAGFTSLNAGSRNILIGAGTATVSASVDDSIGLGYAVGTLASNQFVVGNSTNANSITNAYVGQGVQGESGTAPTGITLNASGGNGTNIAGGPLTLAAGKSTGSATPASIFFATSTAIGSGTTLQTLTNRWQVNGVGGHFIAVLDNTYDIGASGATRPRTGYFGTSLVSPLFNGLAITNNGTNTLAIAAGKTVTFDHTSTFTTTDSQTYTFPTTSATLARIDAANTFTGASTGTSWTMTTPVFAGGLTASGSGANTFAGSTGTFITSTGANTLSGAVTINDATTPSLTTAAGKTNTGFVQINGKTSGALKLLAADAAAQTVTVNLAAQTTGAATVTIPDMAGVNDTISFLAKTETLTNKRITTRVTQVVSTTTSVTIDVSTTDMHITTAQAGALLYNNPTGTPTSGQKLMIRIKDDATARALTWDTQFRASSDLALPTTTILSKTLYMGFVWNAADTKWDLMAVLNNF